MKTRINVSNNPLARPLDKYMRDRPDGQYDINELTLAIGLNPIIKGHTTKVYTLIMSWQSLIRDYWEQSGKEGKKLNPENWERLLKKVNNAGMWYIDYDHDQSLYYQPNYDQKLRNDNHKVIKHTKSLVTGLENMDVFGEKLFVTGEPAAKLLSQMRGTDLNLLTDGENTPSQ